MVATEPPDLRPDRPPAPPAGDLDDGDRTVGSIRSQSPTVATEADAMAIAEAAWRPYGPAHETRHVDGADGSFAESYWVWRNPRVELELAVQVNHTGGTRWWVSTRWSRP